jgi:aminoglycoside phosphotransferase family enzyme
MKPDQYRELTTPELVIEFTNICLAQSQAIEREENAIYNRLFERMQIVEAELKARPNDQRRALQALFGTGNLQVRLMAAQANLAVDYHKSRRELAAVAATRWMPQAAEAGMTLEDLDTGFYRPS